MPFKKFAARRAIGSQAAEDQGEQLNLPDDLACLADQLAVDADRLVEVYPAGSPELWLGESQRQSEQVQTGWLSGVHASRWRIAAAVALVAVGFASWGWLGRPGRHEQVTVQTPAALDVNNAQASTASPAVVGDAPTGPAAGIPAGLFQSLSSPEQEALLDLMEHEGIEQSSLSI